MSTTRRGAIPGEDVGLRQVTDLMTRAVNHAHGTPMLHDPGQGAGPTIRFLAGLDSIQIIIASEAVRAAKRFGKNPREFFEKGAWR